MDRRKFLQITATGTGGVLMLPQFLWANPFAANDIALTENKLLFIQLNGGNDGLNTFIPFNDPIYYDRRPTIAVSKDHVLNTAHGMGFHPALKDFATMMQDGNLSVIQNVGYPNPNRSHFRSQEIWQTASDSHQYLDHGWLGKFLDIQCKEEALNAVNVDNIDNLALKSTTFQGVTVKNFNKLKNYNLKDNQYKLSSNQQLDFVRKLQYASIEGMNEINKALQNAEKFTTEYAKNPLAKNLEWMAKLIKGNLGSKVYYTSLNGFDTHNNQVQGHKNQLSILNDAVYSFYKDMKASNLLQQVTVVIFSEFGRRLQQNGTGTDHGTAGPMFIIGGNNTGKILGENPNLNNLDNGDLIHSIDFRSVYATLLKNKYDFDPSLINIKNATISNLF